MTAADRTLWLLALLLIGGPSFAAVPSGQKIDPAESRRMHLGALRSIDDLISPERKFIVSGYDHVLERVQVLARFEEAWVECELISNQLVSCEQVRAPG